MKFRFNVNLTEDDYYEFNRFHMIKSEFGKKQILKMRIFVAVFIVIVSLGLLFADDFSYESFITLIPLAVILIVVEFGYVKLTEMILKLQLKSMKKSGKMGFDPTSVLEFYDDAFVEITDTVRTEQKYAVVESININNGQILYIYVNNIRAYLLPLSSFETKEQFGDFIDFLKQKTGKEATF